MDAVTRQSPKRYLPFLLILCAAAVASLLLNRNVDFRVYWYAVTGYFSGVRPAYGPLSGIGAPMDYVYPPPSYLLLYPLRWFSLRAGGIIWTLAEFTALAFSVRAAVSAWRLTFRPAPLVLCCLLMLPYLVISARYGNVQPFVMAAVLGAFALAETKPALAGFLLALAVTFKFTPLFFLLWFLKRWKVVASWVASIAALWTAPLLLLGNTRYAALLRDWWLSAAQIGTSPSEFHYFPGQSLRALCLRLLTPIEPAVPGYPKVNFLALRPTIAVRIWEVAAAIILAVALILFWSVLRVSLGRSRNQMALWAAQAFLLYSLLQPFAVKVSLISLGPAALIGGACLSGWAGHRSQQAKYFYFAATALSLLVAFLQKPVYLHWLQAIGVDFWIGSLLVTALSFWMNEQSPRDPSV